jgi:hypothetical protein
MPDVPFRRVADAAEPRRRVAVAGLLHTPRSVAADKASQGSRRRKLWDLLAKFHCPVVGVCFEVNELRTLISRVMHFPREAADFMLHTTAVGTCDTRSRLSEVLQKDLERRFPVAVRRFSGVRSADGVRALWRESCKTGSDIPGALWASWTHPACDASLAQEIYADIHMIQHQVGSGTRADLAALQALQAENAELRKQLNEARADAEAQRSERSREAQILGRQIAELRAELAGKDGVVATVTGQLDALRQSLPEFKARQSLARRASDVEARATALRASVADLEGEVERLGRLVQHAEETIEHLLVADASATGQGHTVLDEPPPNLAGKRILCVGARSGSVEAYRKMVEQRGGSFLHHDCGLEENLNRIDAALAAADLVVCQAGCISHNAYWRVKEQCKRSGKPCVFVRGAGVTSFGRVVGAAGAGNEESGVDRLSSATE